jgi:rubrerythrin
LNLRNSPRPIKKLEQRRIAMKFASAMIRATRTAGPRLVHHMRPSAGLMVQRSQCFARMSSSALDGSKTQAHLRDALAGKCMAKVRYAYMAQQADVEGSIDEASVFRAVAESEENHAMGHLEFLQDSGDPVTSQPISNTVEMLNSAVAGEHHDSSTMYPEFARVAREEGFEEIAEWFETLAVAEGIHLRRFQHLLEEVPNM